MKTLNDIKEEVAKESGYPDWSALINEMSDPEIYEFYLDGIINRVVEYCNKGQFKIVD